MLHGMRQIFKFSILALSRVLTFNLTWEMKRKVMLVTLTSNYTDSDIASFFFKWLREQEEGQMVLHWPHYGINDNADQVHVVMEIVSNEGNVMPCHFSPRSLRFNNHVLVQELMVKFWTVWVAVRVFSHDRYYPGVVDQAFSRSQRKFNQLHSKYQTLWGPTWKKGTWSGFSVTWSGHPSTWSRHPIT